MVLLLFISPLAGFNQTISLPDTNLVKKLQADYPEVMQGELLLIPEASQLTTTLNLENSNINNPEGIQYFTSIKTLVLTGNEITEIPDISTIVGLENLYASNNLIDSLPDLSALEMLRDIQVMNNRLRSLPALPQTTELLNIYCSDNEITQFPDFSVFPNLTRLIIGSNKLTASSLDFSKNTNLENLHVHNLNLDTIIGLEHLVKLQVLYAWGNQLKSLNGLNSNTTLTFLSVFNNNLVELPNLMNKSQINTLDVRNCQLTFEDIVPILGLDTLITFNYNPQKNFHLGDLSIREKQSYSVEYPIINPENENIYVWYKNELVIDSNTTPQLDFTNISYSDTGHYKLKVYHPSTPNLILTSNSFLIHVLPCIEIDFIDPIVLNENCSSGFEIDISNSTISGGTLPFTYNLNNGITNQNFSSPIFDFLEPGNYDLKIIDSKNCSATASFSLEENLECEIVLTPNDDGVADTYFIEFDGLVEIYNMKRKLIRTLETPASWDGTDDNGELVDAGYYMIRSNDMTPVYISVIK